MEVATAIVVVPILGLAALIVLITVLRIAVAIVPSRSISVILMPALLVL